MTREKREKNTRKKRGDSKREKQETDVTAAEIQVDGGKPLDGRINKEKVKDGWRDEKSEGVEEQTGAERRWRQESNLVKSEWDVLFLNVESRTLLG